MRSKEDTIFWIGFLGLLFSTILTFIVSSNWVIGSLLGGALVFWSEVLSKKRRKSERDTFFFDNVRETSDEGYHG